MPVVASPLSTEELVVRCRAGDAEAWSALVDRFGRLVHGVALREGLGREDAADVAQEVFIALLERLDQIERPASVSWWLMTVARRHSWRRRDHGRRLRVEEDVVDIVDDDPASSTVGDGEQPDEWIEAAWVHEAVATLPAPCRELLELLFLDPAEPSYRQVSRLLDMPVGSIGSCRARCLEQLRQRLSLEVVS